MSARSLGLAAAALAAAAVCPAADWQVVRRYQDPNDVRFLHHHAGWLLGQTHSGLEWSVSGEELLAAVTRPGRPVAWGGIGPRERVLLAVEGGEGPGTHPLLPSTMEGWPVTEGAVYRGNLYLATFGGGLFRDDGTAVAGTPADIRALEEVAGLLVMAHAEGLTLFDGTVVRHVRLVGPPADNVSSLALGAGYLWAGYFDGGLARMKDGVWETVPTPGPPGASWVNSLCWDGEALWIGSEAGLGRWVPGARSVCPVERLRDPVQSVRCGGEVLVVAGPRYVALHRGGEWTRHDMPYDYLHAARRVGEAIWAGGMGGLLRLEGDRWKRYSQMNGALPDSWVTAVLPVGEALWIGTYDAGLVSLGADGRARMVRADAWVNPNALAGAGGQVAVGTMEEGLLLLDRDSGGWRRLTRKDGLPSDDVTAILDTGDTLWVGTRGGVAELRPSRP